MLQGPKIDLNIYNISLIRFIIFLEKYRTNGVVKKDGIEIVESIDGIANSGEKRDKEKKIVQLRMLRYEYTIAPEESLSRD